MKGRRRERELSSKQDVRRGKVGVLWLVLELGRRTSQENKQVADLFFLQNR